MHNTIVVMQTKLKCSLLKFSLSSIMIDEHSENFWRQGCYVVYALSVRSFTVRMKEVERQMVKLNAQGQPLNQNREMVFSIISLVTSTSAIRFHNSFHCIQSKFQISFLNSYNLFDYYGNFGTVTKSWRFWVKCSYCHFSVDC